MSLYAIKEITLDHNDIAGLTVSLDRFLYRYVRDAITRAHESDDCQICAAAGDSFNAANKFLQYYLSKKPISPRKALDRTYHDDHVSVKEVTGVARAEVTAQVLRTK